MRQKKSKIEQKIFLTLSKKIKNKAKKINPDQKNRKQGKKIEYLSEILNSGRKKSKTEVE